MITYREALNRCLEGVRDGRDFEEVIATLPRRHANRLRQDAALAEAVRRYAATAPGPSPEAERAALARLSSELAAARGSRGTPAGPRMPIGLPRFALAGLAVAALLAATGFLLLPSGENGGAVEAAVFEGVVVASGEGALTVQTLDTLEEVSVPGDAGISDDSGALLELTSIEVGEVVHVRGRRESGRPVLATDVRRLVEGLPGWCDDHPERCRRIAQNLRDARQRCETNPDACHRLHDRVTDLIDRANDVADLEDLKQRCRLSGGQRCRDFTSFCREHRDVCIRNLPPPITDRIEQARERLQALDSLCAGSDTTACREVARICADHPVLCDPLSPR